MAMNRIQFQHGTVDAGISEGLTEPRRKRAGAGSGSLAERVLLFTLLQAAHYVSPVMVSARSFSATRVVIKPR